MKNNNTTNALSEALQTKTKHLIIATKGEQHIKVEPNYLYEINIKDGDVLTSDVNLIAKKVGSDLEVLLENDTIVIFDNYFEMCATDLSCLVSLPSKEGVYYVVDDNVTTLADGSQIVHSYGDEQALSAIAEGQSGLFETSFNDGVLAGEISAFTYLAPLLALGGASISSDGSSGNPTTTTTTTPPTLNPIYGTNGADILSGTIGNDEIYGYESRDEIYGNEGNDTLFGGDGNDIIYGGDGRDTLFGGHDHDTLFGGDGNDIIHGGWGDDFIRGGRGNDNLRGDAGKDRFIYESVIDDGYRDIIGDFQVGTGTNADVLDLAGLLTYDQNNPNHDILDFITLIDNSASTTFNIDTDGNGSGANVSIELLGITGTDLNTMINDGNIVLF